MDAKRKFFNSRPLFYTFLAFLLALATTKFVFDGNIKYIIFDCLILLVFIGMCLWTKSFNMLAVVLAVFCLGIGWWFVGISTFQQPVPEGESQVVARLTDDMTIYYDDVSVVAKNVKINGKNAKNLNLYIKGGAGKVKEGDIIAFNAKVENAQLFNGESFNSFYYRDGTPYEAEVSNFVVQGNQLLPVERFRMSIKENLKKNMGAQQGAVAYAILFGDKSDIDKETYNNFKSAGIVHLLTVSGLHISFLLALLGFVLKKLKVKGVLNFLICFALLGMYAYACNFSPSILRAGIMGLVWSTTIGTGKCYDGLNSLGLAGLIILTIFPLFALDLGFLMSFFCVLAIYTLCPLVSKWLQKVFPNSVAKYLGLTISVQVGILPFLAAMSTSFNFLSAFANLLIIPIFSLAYPILFVGSLLTLFLPFGFLLNIAGFGLKLIFQTAQFFSQTGLILNLSPINIFCVATFFLLIFVLSKYFVSNKKVKASCCSVLGATTLVLLFAL